MLDVHPPEHTPHTWRDFFLHIATIVVGLIIAVGLEQTVEFIHHRHQRAELQETLLADAKKAVQDAEDENRADMEGLQYMNRRIAQLQMALATNQPLAPAPPFARSIHFDQPDDPAWKAAKNSGLIEVLPQDEIKAYSEIDAIINHAEDIRIPGDAAFARTIQFGWKFQPEGVQEPDFSHASRQNLEDYLDMLLATKFGFLRETHECQALHGAELAILKGERDLNSIQRAEGNSW